MTREVQQPKSNGAEEACALSRRSFLRLATGSLTMLPVVAGGVLVSTPPVPAYGEEDLEAQADTSTLTIVATRVDQVCVSVIDIENGRRSARAIVGAKVKLTSYYNKKSVEGTTDERGVAILTIADLAEEDEKKKGKYTFRAYLEASASGYRIYRTGLAIIDGGKGLELGTQPLESGVPYPSRASFDDWDILYTNNSFCRAKVNNYNHEIAIELEDLATSPLTIRLMDNNDKVYAQGTTTPKSGHALITFKGMFLKDGNKAALPFGGNFLVQFDQNGTTYEHPVSLVVRKPEGKEDEDPKIYDKLYKLSPLTSVSSLLEFTVPQWVPILRGGKMRFFPDFSFPIMCSVDPFAGVYTLSINMNALRGATEVDPTTGQKRYADFYGWKTKNGQPDPDKWAWHPYSTMEEQAKKVFDDSFKDAKELRQNLKTAVANNTSQWQKEHGIGALPGVWNSSFKLSFWLNFAAKWSGKANVWQINGGSIAACMSLDKTFSKQFMVGYIPMFLSLRFGINASASLNALAFTTTDLFSFSKWRFDYSTNLIALNIVPSISLSLGAGIKGLASFAFKGSISFTIGLGFNLRATPTNENLPKPAAGKRVRYTVSFGLKLGVEIQVWLMVIEKMWPTVDVPNFIDNWRDDGSGMDAQAFDQMAVQAIQESTGMGLLDCLNDPYCECTIISDDSLAGLVEAVGSYEGILMGAQAEGEDAAVSDFAYETLETEDGSCGFWTMRVAMGSSVPWDTSAGQPEEQGVAEQPPTEVVAESEPATDDTLVPGAETVAAEAAEAAVLMSQAEGAGAGIVAGLYEGEATTAESVPTLEALSNNTTLLQAQEEAVEADEAEMPQAATGDAPETESEPQTEANELQAETSELQGGTDESPEEQPSADNTAEVQAERASVANSFVPTRSYMYAQGVVEDTGVKSIGSDGGLVPSIDVQLDSDIFSDPRTKIVDILDTPHAFRLAVTSIDGAPRTRVICQQLDDSRRGLGTRVFDTHWLQKQQLFNRIDLYDYDFGVYVEQRAASGLYLASGYIHIFLVSGRRAEGTGTSISKLATDQAFGYAFFHYQVKQSGEVEFFDDLGILFPATDFNYTSTAAHPYHMFSCPHITPVDPNLWRGEQLSYGYSPMFFTFLDRAADNPDDVFCTEEGAGTGADPDIGLGMGFVQVEGSGTVIKFVDTNALGFGTITDYSVYGMSCSAKLPGTDWFLIQLFGNELTHPILVKATNTITQSSGIVAHPIAVPAVLSIKPGYYPSDGDEDYSAAKLIYWRNGDFLATVSKQVTGESAASYGDEPGYESHLCRVHIADLDGSPSFVFKDAGVKGVGVEGFCVGPYGDDIYWPVLREDEPVYDVDETGGQTKTDKTRSYYAIMASEFWNPAGYVDSNEGTFCEPYVFAEVTHRMDTLVLPARSDASYEQSSLYTSVVSFLSTEIVDPKAGKANLWYTSMPAVRSLTVTSIMAASSIVLPGKNVDINVAVRNDGNEWLKCCQVNVCKLDGTVVHDSLLMFDEDTLLESNHNPRREDGTLENNEYDYWLAPGRSSVYRLSFPVPADWSGETKVVVRVSTLQLVDNSTPIQAQSGLMAMAEAETPMEWLGVLEDEPAELFKVGGGDYEVNVEELSPAPVTVKRGSSSSSGGTSNTGSRTSSSSSSSGGTSNTGSRTSSSSSSTSTKREALPQTGDENVFGGLELALGALGAAMVAYSKRRCEIEESENES